MWAVPFWLTLLSPSIRAPVLVDGLETVDRWRSSKAAKIEVERNPRRVWEGGGCMRLTFKVDLRRKPPWWECVERSDLDLPLPREVRLWIFPLDHPAIYVLLQDPPRGTAFFRVNCLKVREWNLVSLPLDVAAIWGKRPKRLREIRFCVHPEMGFPKSGEFSYLVDGVEAVYDWALGPSTKRHVVERYSLILLPEALRGKELTLDKASVTDGEKVTMRASLPWEVDDFRARFVLSSPKGKRLVFERRFRGREARTGGAQLELWGDALPEGDYRVEAQVRLPGGDWLSLGSAELRKVAPPRRWAEVERKARALSRRVDKLEGLLLEAQRRGIKAPYVKAAISWLRRFLDTSDVEVRDGRVYWLMGRDFKRRPNPVPLDFGECGLWEKWEGDLQFLSRLCGWAEGRLRRLLKHPGEELDVPERNLRRVIVKGGNFWADGKPVVFVGFQGGWGLRGTLPKLREFGFNAVNPIWLQWAVAPCFVWEREEIDRGRISAFAEDELFKHNLAALLPIHFDPPGWAYKKHPDLRGWGPTLPRSYPKMCGGGFMRFALEAPSARELVRTWYEAVVPVLKRFPSLRLYDLHVEFSYHSQTEIYLQRFRKFLKRRYGEISNLNRAWRTNFKGFEQIPFPFERKYAFPDESFRRRFCVSGFKECPKNKVVWRDWLEFHQGQVADWFRWLTKEVKRLDPEGLVTFRPVMNIHWIPEQGVDWEEMAEFMDVLGGNFYTSFPGVEFGLNVFDAPVSATGINLDFLHSIAPNKPLGNYAFHPHSLPPRSLWRRAPEGYAYALIWHCFLHGMRFCTFWLWEMGWPYRGAPEVNCSAFPEVAWDISRAALDLRRLAEFVCQFPPEGTKVGLLLPRLSVFLDRGLFYKVSKVYRALDFIGAPTKFVTERTMERGALDGLKVLVVPGAPYLPEASYRRILDFVGRGGALVLVGEEALKFDEWGRARDLSSLQSGRVRRLSLWELSPQELAQELRGILRAYDSLPPVKVSTLEGRIPWGVEWRATRFGDGWLVYLLNLNLEGVEVRLEPPPGRWEASELISGEKVSFDLELGPFATRLLLLRPV